MTDFPGLMGAELVRDDCDNGLVTRMKVKREDEEEDVQETKVEGEAEDGSSQDSQATIEEAAELEGSEQEDHCPTRPEADSSWRVSKPFLLQLSCLTEEGSAVPFENRLSRHLTVSSDYTICGFQDREKGASTMILVNKADNALSLEPETMGKVLGISSTGLAIPAKGKAHHRKFMEKHALPHRLRDGTVFHKDGMATDSIQPRLREYIKEERRKLFLPGKPTLIPVAHAYAMAQDYFHKKMFNWAQHRTEYIRRRLVREALPLTAKDLLCHYISVALPCAQRPSEAVPSGAGGQVVGTDNLKLNAMDDCLLEPVHVARRVETSHTAPTLLPLASKEFLPTYINIPVPFVQGTTKIVTCGAGLGAAAERKKQKSLWKGTIACGEVGNTHESYTERPALDPPTTTSLAQGLKRKQGDVGPDQPDKETTTRFKNPGRGSEAVEIAHALDMVRQHLEETGAEMQAKNEQIQALQTARSELLRQLTASQAKVALLERLVDDFTEWRRASKE